MIAEKQVNKHPTLLAHLHVRGVYAVNQRYHRYVLCRLPRRIKYRESFLRKGEKFNYKMCMYAGNKTDCPYEASLLNYSFDSCKKNNF